jgi:MYXO-CTERM domain-containing protein
LDSDPFPTAAAPNNLIAAFWTDIVNTVGGGPLVFQTLGATPNRRLIVQWHNWSHIDIFLPFGNEPATQRFQIKLFEGSNIIEMHYGIGIENAAGTVGLQYRRTTSQTASTTPTALTGTAVRFGLPPLFGGTAAVNDGAGADIDEQLSGAEVTANWTGFAGAGGAAIRTFEVAIGRTAGGTEIQGFTDVGNVLTATFGGLTLKVGDVIFVTVRGTDVNGVVTAAVTSDGLRIIGVQQNSSGGHGGPCSTSGASTRPRVAAALLAVAALLLALRRRFAGR